MDIQRLRNLTTGFLHTKMEHIYEDIEFFTGAKGIMTHQLPNAARALEPFLKTQFTDTRLWDGKYDVTHTGEVEVQPMDAAGQDAFWERYKDLPHPLGKRQL